MKKPLFILTVGRYELAPGYFGTLLTVSAVICCISLGYWQIHRADEKKALLATWQQNETLPAKPFFEELPAATNQTLTLVGRYQPDRQFLLDNRIHKGRAGYDVYTPFTLLQGGDLLINRGWIEAPKDRALLPELPLVEERQQLLVRAYGRTRLPPVFGEKAEADRWPIRIQIPDVKLMADLARLRLASDTEMRLLAGQNGALLVSSPVAHIKPEKHHAYAVQWFMFAGLALILWLVFARRPSTKLPP